MTWDPNGTPAQDTLGWPSHPGDDGLPAPAWTYSHNNQGEAVAYYPGLVVGDTVDVGPTTGTGSLVRQNAASLRNVDITSGSLIGSQIVLSECIGYRLQLWDATRVMGALQCESVNSIIDFLTEGNGVRFPGAGWVYSSSGGSIVIRRRAGNGPVAIEDNNGTNQRNIVTEAGATFAGNVSIAAANNEIGLPGQTPHVAFTGVDGRMYGRTYSQQIREGNPTNYDGVLVFECAVSGVSTIGGYIVGSTTPPTWFVQGEMTAQTVTQRSARADKLHIAPAKADAISAVWHALKPTQFFWRGMHTRTDNRRKFGFTADELPSELVALDGSGYDLAQLLAVTIARVKQLEAELAGPRSTRRSWWRLKK